MTLIKVQPDRQWTLAEVRIRLTVDAAISDEQLLYNRDLHRQIEQDIERIASKRGWRYIEYVPRGASAHACCDALRQPMGTPIRVRLEESPLQADTDDAHNSGNAFDAAGHRMFVQGKRDIVAIVHFLQPASILNMDAVREGMPTEGFLSPGEMPEELKHLLMGSSAGNA